MAEPCERWEIPELIAELDPGIAARLLATHPDAGWCHRCRVTAPCPTRGLAEAAALVVARAYDGPDG